MQDDIFKYGIIVGRFQHIHKGHEKLINIGLKLCNKLLVFIGSANQKTSARVYKIVPGRRYLSSL